MDITGQKTVRTVLLCSVRIALTFFICIVLCTLLLAPRNEDGRRVFDLTLYPVGETYLPDGNTAAGDVAVIRRTAADGLSVGDRIAVISSDPRSFGQTVTRQITALPADGTVCTADPETGETLTVMTSQILGKYVGKLSGMGRFSDSLRTPAGYAGCIFLPALALLTMESILLGRALDQKRGAEKDPNTCKRDESSI